MVLDISIVTEEACRWVAHCPHDDARQPRLQTANRCEASAAPFSKERVHLWGGFMWGWTCWVCWSEWLAGVCWSLYSESGGSVFWVWRFCILSLAVLYSLSVFLCSCCLVNGCCVVGCRPLWQNASGWERVEEMLHIRSERWWGRGRRVIWNAQLTARAPTASGIKLYIYIYLYIMFHTLMSHTCLTD